MMRKREMGYQNDELRNLASIIISKKKLGVNFATSR